MRRRRRRRSGSGRGAFFLYFACSHIIKKPPFHQMSQELHSTTLQVLFFCCCYLFLPLVHDVHMSAPDQINQFVGENEQQTNLVRYQLIMKRIISFSYAKTAMGFAILLAFLNGAQDIRAMHSSTVIIAYYFLIWSTLISPILLFMYSVVLFWLYNRIYQNQKIHLICMITISCVVLIVTSFFSIVLRKLGEGKKEGPGNGIVKECRQIKQ